MDKARIGCFSCQSEIKRTFRFLDRSDRNAVRIDHGRFQAGVSEQRLDGADVAIGPLIPKFLGSLGIFLLHSVIHENASVSFREIQIMLGSDDFYLHLQFEDDGFRDRHVPIFLALLRRN